MGVFVDIFYECGEVYRDVNLFCEACELEAYFTTSAFESRRNAKKDGWVRKFVKQAGEYIDLCPDCKQRKRELSKFIVCAYYTHEIPYIEASTRLMKSLTKFNLESEVRQIETLGSWQRNTHYKPHFILEMLDKYRPKPVVYTDIDSEFMSYPHLFDKLNCDIAAYLLDHRNFRRRTTKPELLSGTLYFGNTEKAREIIHRWIEICKALPTVWDQATLQQTVEELGYEPLPPQYCCINGYMDSVPDPVILHYQASREARFLERKRNQFK